MVRILTEVMLLSALYRVAQTTAICYRERYRRTESAALKAADSL
jgi:hypothetical protein